MTAALQTALVLIALLLVKHLFADFFFQTQRMLSGRDEYVHVGRAQHAAIHGAFSFGVFVVLGTPLVFSLVICLAETVLHYHIDWAKGRHAARCQHSPTDAGYWRAFGFDQFLHQLTYVAMVWAWAFYTL